MKPGNPVAFCAGWLLVSDTIELVETTREASVLGTVVPTATELDAKELVATILEAKNEAVVVGCSGTYVNIGGVYDVALSNSLSTSAFELDGALAELEPVGLGD